ncbi:family 16 glycosylhydrolase [Hyunsoonleella sp. SJ7]|uniref:Family 16 glycosylhydrolase n=1 Tax=Hyunsoonleella aquatilis TaxID=2762758 RepID=A0A923HAA3_9FLAO|nr:family 16 glycosylhydrolase [Hyunsoonleella aquatilis]MBC3759700.1 family 16 glycosylhydrolase [Hyunsoonleella aquatilis]
MKKKYYFSYLVLFICLQLSFAQQTPIDFSNSSHTFSSWGGSSFSVIPDPVDSNNDVGNFFRNTSPLEQGNYIDLSRPIDLDVEDEITLRFYADDPLIHTIIVKLENGTNPSVEVSQTLSSEKTWTNLTFDFSTVAGTGQYSRLTIRIDDGSTTPGAFQIDDINDGNVVTDPNALDVIYNDLVWSDEFDSSTSPEVIDGSKWHHQTIGPNGGQWFNFEEQHYTDRINNSFMVNGNLHIVARKETYTNQGVTLDYTSARLNSKFAFTYGRVDVRAQLPAGTDGTWPAIWTLGKNITETGAYWQTQGFGTTPWPDCGEIDIMEHGLHDATNETSVAIHTPSSNGNTVNTDKQVLSDVTTNFHVYSVNWSPNQITFLVDGVGFYTYNPAVKDASTWPFDLDQYLILNVAMGGISGAIDPSFTQSAMVIDYVRVYQNNGLSIDENDTNLFKVYPNPSETKINIQGNGAIDNIELFDTYGKLIKRQRNAISTLDVSDVSSGLYLLSIQSGSKTEIKKVLVQ